ncbi:MAG: S8 family serine peptidase, partial [Candidatus Eisenbacteria bacterium]|nr:S8 family serine peptidase [Candidatus Eisenbacteria bacterium]
SDGHGHGTHVMGIMVGLDAEAGDTLGVAFGAEWIAANALSFQVPDSSFANSVLESFQWFADPDGDPATSDDVPDVLQNSWGVLESEGYRRCDPHWWGAIDNLEAAGTVVIFSAGNEGPGRASLRSPADRADTPLQNFSVGAVSANGEVFPYPIAAFSSRGPSTCPPGTAIKPEIVAPGVGVYSSWISPEVYNVASGTSMAGPHVAGVVALMRQANPDLTVDEVKQILLDTAIAYGAEDNTYGHGLVNAYEAVLGAVSAAGATRVSGVVRDPDGAPLPEASVTIDPGYAWTTSATGRFGGFAQAGDYSVTVEHELLQTRSLGVRHLEVGLPFDLDVTLQDRSGPVVRDLSLRDAVQAVGDSLEIRATLVDFSGTAEAQLWMRRDDASGSEAWRSLPMESRAGNWSARFPLERFGDEFSYYIESSDRIGNVALHPAGGSAAPLHGSYLRLVFEDDAEEDRGWSLGSAGDTPYGHWIRLDPFGTSYLGAPIEPADDHSEPGIACFVTGKGRIDAPPGASDVDDGCVTLTSP